MGCGSCSSGWCPPLRFGRRAVASAGTGTGRCWRPSSSWPRRAVHGASRRRVSAHPDRPRTDGPPSGVGPGCGQAPPPGAGRARRPQRVGLVVVCGRLGEHAGDDRGDLTGPNPVDRGKKGSKIHLITERTGLPLSIGISAANTHDSRGLEPLERGIPPIRSRRGPRRRRPAKLHADKGYDYDHLRRWLRTRRIVPRIAHKGIPAAGPPSLDRGADGAWLAGCRRLHRRYERKAGMIHNPFGLFCPAAGLLLSVDPYQRGAP